MVNLHRLKSRPKNRRIPSSSLLSSSQSRSASPNEISNQVYSMSFAVDHDSAYRRLFIEQYRKLEDKESKKKSKLRNNRKLTSYVPLETWVDCLRFLGRDYLQTLQLTVEKFGLLVDSYFTIYPLRRVRRVKLRTVKKMQLKIDLFSESSQGSPQKIIESDSEPSLWLHQCHVNCIEFVDFHFTDELLRELAKIGPELLSVDYCFFDYGKRFSQNPLTEGRLVKLFNSVHGFGNCLGSIFSFGRKFATLRPSLVALFALSQQNSLILDYDLIEDGYSLNPTEIQIVSDWLNHHGPASVTRALSLRGFNIPMEFFTKLQTAFEKDSANCSYILDVEDGSFDPWEDPSITVENKKRGEMFVIEAKEDQPLSISRCRIPPKKE